MNEKYHIHAKNEINGLDLSLLTQQLQKEDARNLRVFKNFRYIFLAMIIFYSLLMIVNPDSDLSWFDRIAGGCYVIAFIILAWLFRKYHREYSTIDYSLPVAEMLEKAATRYSLKKRNSLIIIIPLALIDVGLTLSYAHRGIFSPDQWIWGGQLVYFSVLAIAFLIGVWIWYKRQKPLRDKALKLLEELNTL